jgi:endonuclease IV
MVRIGHHVQGGADVLLGVKVAQQYGMTALQAFAGNPMSYLPTKTVPASHVPQIQEFMQDCYGSVHAPYFAMHGEDLQRPQQIRCREGLVAQLEWAEWLGFDCVVSHVGSQKDYKDRDWVISNVTRSVTEILDRYEGPVKLCLENHCKDPKGRYIGWGLDELAGIVDSHDDPRLRMCWDTTHAWSSGYSIDRLIDDYVVYQDLVEVIHFNVPNPGVQLGGHKDMHRVAFDEGEWSLPAVRSLFRELIDKPLIIEGTTSIERDLQHAQEWAQQIYADQT